jgi:hypothetical protein
MKGNISLKDFILGVKKELQDASAEGAKNPFLELNQVELEAEFGLEISGGVEGKFSFFVKATAEAGASQSHKVKLIFSPIRNNVMFSVAPSDSTDQTSGTPIEPFSITSASSGPGPYFHSYPAIRIGPDIDVDELVRKTIDETIRMTTSKVGGNQGSGEDGA